MKLYFNSLNNTKFESIAIDACKREVSRCIEHASTALDSAQLAFSGQACADMVAFSHYFVSATYWQRRIVNDIDRTSSLFNAAPAV